MNTAISEKVLKFYNQLDDKNNRYLSWEHCYNYFNEPDIDVDKACLHFVFILLVGECIAVQAFFFGKTT